MGKKSNYNPINELITITNTCFYSFEASRNILIKNTVCEINQREQKEIFIDDILKKIYKEKSTISLDGTKYTLIKFKDYSKFKRISSDNEKQNIFLSIEKKNGKYNLSTNNYCGSISINDNVLLTITCNISDLFFKRILNFCCGIYADLTKESDSKENHGIYSLIVQYMYLISLRKVIHKTFPKNMLK